ncbi:hypothetical protein, partial [uncultured Parasutterella sp.]|uniref:hypothetical protein n=1 Tax=uncultured Parasutterella sp. TaxID=1263098 RepID=UPI0025931648
CSTPELTVHLRYGILHEFRSFAKRLPRSDQTKGFALVIRSTIEAKTKVKRPRLQSLGAQKKVYHVPENLKR